MLDIQFKWSRNVDALMRRMNSAHNVSGVRYWPKAKIKVAGRAWRVADRLYRIQRDANSAAEEASDITYALTA